MELRLSIGGYAQHWRVGSVLEGRLISGRGRAGSGADTIELKAGTKYEFQLYNCLL